MITVSCINDMRDGLVPRPRSFPGCWALEVTIDALEVFGADVMMRSQPLRRLDARS